MLKSGWASGVFEILNDSNDIVVVEGLSIMAEYYYAFRKKNFADYFNPHFSRMLSLVSLRDSPLALKQTFARNIGRFFHRVTILNLFDQSVRAEIFNLFKQFLLYKLEDHVATVKVEAGFDFDQNDQAQGDSGSDSLFTLAAMNLPCFFKFMQHTAKRESNTSQP